MAWIEVCLSVPGDSSAPAEHTLEQLGALSVTLEDGADNPVLEPGPGETPLWPFVRVRGLFETAADREAIMTALRAVPGAARPDQILWREVADQDWERAWMDRFQPMRFGQHLWIVPGGMKIPRNPAMLKFNWTPAWHSARERTRPRPCAWNGWTGSTSPHVASWITAAVQEYSGLQQR